ncbi:hypothetical protein [Sediminicurvatus halobius]|nr:hypothetical protein [Spiribacter halobius]
MAGNRIEGAAQAPDRVEVGAAGTTRGIGSPVREKRRQPNR